MLARHYIALKVNLNLQYFYLIEIWKFEVQGRNLSKIFGILTSGFGHRLSDSALRCRERAEIILGLVA